MRTLLTQVDVPNPDGALRPGMYLQVKFVAARAAPAVLIPSAALVTLNDGVESRCWTANQAVRYRRVRLSATSARTWKSCPDWMAARR